MNRCLISLLKNTLSKLNCLVITYIFNQNNWIFEKILKKHFAYIVVLKASGVGKGTLAPMPAPTIQWVFRKYLKYTIKYHFSFFSCAKSFFLSVMVLSYLYYLNDFFSGDRRCGNHAGQIWLQTVKQVIVFDKLKPILFKELYVEP